ncbi:hypothetical protein BGP75_24535 [Motiliproteus sp. MSK22-1]|nr:hypothetical protein BGP75_24535 [Motiliproteus sp. MSK22-1]
MTMPVQAIEVITTIKPIQLIALSITKGTKEPQMLLPAHSSPHDYQMRPSDMQKLQKADLVFWVGPSLERFLSNVQETSPESTNWIELQALFESEATQSQIKTTENSDEMEHASEHQQDHNHEGMDPHIWLSPIHAGIIARKIAATLIESDPESTQTYSDNLAEFLKQLQKQDLSLKKQLSEIKDSGYYVFHDAYGYFERHYGLHHLGAFTLSPDRKPGAKRLQNIREQLESSDVRCVFTEPQFKPSMVRAITEGLKVNTQELDPLATSIALHANGYFMFLQQLADSYVACLKK